MASVCSARLGNWLQISGKYLSDPCIVFGMNTTDLLQISSARQAAKSGEASEIRRAAGLSQAEVASVVGVTASAVSRWEGGDRLPRGMRARRYAVLLDSLKAAA